MLPSSVLRRVRGWSLIITIYSGGCERIQNTPIAPSYRVILNHALVLYLLLLPWGVVDEFAWWTIPIAFITTYCFTGAEGIANRIEHPFFNAGQGLQLDQICEAIDASVSELFATSATDPPWFRAAATTT